MTDARDEQQRVEKARQVQLPWWYVALFAAAVLGLMGAPFIGRATSWPLASWAVTCPALVVLYFADRVFRRSTGVQMTRGMLRAYPSSRPAGRAMLLVIGSGIVVVSIFVRAGLLAVAVIVAVAASVVAVRCLLRQTDAIRNDYSKTCRLTDWPG